MRATSREVKLKLIEFLYFYLMPEAPTLGTSVTASAPATVAQQHQHQRGPSKVTARSMNEAGVEGVNMGEYTKSMEEKQGLLGRYLNNVEDLVDDLRDNAPFGGTVY